MDEKSSSEEAVYSAYIAALNHKFMSSTPHVKSQIIRKLELSLGEIMLGEVSLTSHFKPALGKRLREELRDHALGGVVVPESWDILRL